jgi:hypothetical protein
MGPLSSQNIESELSYAYIHAVAAAAGAECNCTGRHSDNAGVDAKLTGWGPFDVPTLRQEVDINVQLKATTKSPVLIQSKLSYSFSGIAKYDDLRSDQVSTPRILVVLFLPQDQSAWIEHSFDALSLKKCAYWVSLRGAPPSTNATSQTIYLPETQRFDRDGLRRLFAEIGNCNVPLYEGLAQ